MDIGRELRGEIAIERERERGREAGGGGGGRGEKRREDSENSRRLGERLIVLCLRLFFFRGPILTC